MGYIRHHAIVITWSDYIDDIEPHAKFRPSSAVLAEIKDTGAIVIVSDTVAVNGYRSAMVCPDGSKEGWADSAVGDERRAAIKAILRKERSGGYSPLDWAEVIYGDDGGEYSITDHADK